MDRHKILEMEITLVQQCITRMAQNSFLIKGWTITLIAALLAIVEARELGNLGIVLVFPCLFFWYLDGFFLKLERLYRWKYEWIIEKRMDTDEFALNLSPYTKKMWLLNADGKQKKPPSVLKVMFSKTLCFYPALIFTLIVWMFQFR